MIQLKKCNLKAISSYFLILFLTIQSHKIAAQCKFEKTTTELEQLNKLREAVEVNPENLHAHENFIKAVGKNDQYLDDQYKKWAIRFPHSATVPFAIGKKYYRSENPKATSYLLKAVEINPKLAEAWYRLHIDALRWGNDSLANYYLGTAAKLEPNNADYALQYAYTYKETEPLKYDSLALDVVRRFPKSERAAQSLSSLANNATNTSKKRAYYEVLKNLYTIHQSDWGRSGMNSYFSLLINTDPEKAFELAINMASTVKNRLPEWSHKINVAKSFIDARDKLNANRPADAIAILDKLKLKHSYSASYIYADEALLLFKAEAADAANNTRGAYDSLAISYSKEPSDRIYARLLSYGVKLGFDSIKVQDDILKIRLLDARTATPFILESYLTDKKVALSDYKGKAVLLTFWFPGCGPCRAEFPHFEAVIKKFSDNDVVYLGINGFREQDDYVVPFMKSTGYSFIPLKEDINRNNENLRATGYPTNYLIDREGRIIFSRFQINNNNERMLELMISELVKKK